MGGNALKNTKTRRYSANEYFALVDEVLSKFKHLFPLEKMEDVKAYRAKADFGDLDVVVKNRPGLKDEFAVALQGLGVEEIVRNGPVWSVGWRDFQVDFLFHSEYEFARNYFAWNDLGNLVGRVAHKLGFKFGHDGLWYVLRDGNYVVSKVLVTSDFYKSLNFLGFDEVRYKDGFDSLEDVFSYVVDNPYFSPDVFLLENRNHQARRRDRKRTTYNRFLAWMESQQFPENELDRHSHLKRAKESFPNFCNKVDLVEHEYARSSEAKHKFNGKLVAQLTCLEGRMLGRFMKHLKLQKPDLTGFVLCADADELAAWVKSEFSMFSV